MKLKTSFFDPVVFRKNLTRFAPVWALYTLCLILGLMLMGNSGLEYWLPAHLADCIQIMPVVNLGYALIVAQILFGDLFSPRMCNALHAMPIRREGWFVTNVASGAVFSLVPTLVMTLIALPLTCLSQVVNAWQIALYWFLGANLQYLFFFGTAVFSAFCVGSRFAMALVYGIANFGAVLIYWLADTIYTPMFYGVMTRYEAFRPFCPVMQMTDYSFRFIDVERVYEDGEVMHRFAWGEFTVMDSWWYLWVCAAVGIGLLAVALLLYRRRKLECAGDFMAVKALEPVFLVLYSITAAAMFQLVYEMFFSGENYIFMTAGLVAGFFTGRMLLERQARVFRKKNWLGFAALAAAVGLSLGLTALDPLGIETWIPRSENVEYVTLRLGHYSDDEVVLTEQADIEKVLLVHEAALEDPEQYDMRIPMATAEEVVSTPGQPQAQENTAATAPAALTEAEWARMYKTPVDITISYKLQSGATVSRYYTIWAGDAEGIIVRDYFSTLQAVAKTDDLVGKLDDVESFYLDGFEVPEEYWTQERIEGLLRAIEADCAAGTLAQHSSFHSTAQIEIAGEEVVTAMWLDLKMDGFGMDIRVYGDSENTLAWLTGQGLLELLGSWHDGKYYG